MFNIMPKIRTKPNHLSLLLTSILQSLCSSIFIHMVLLYIDTMQDQLSVPYSLFTFTISVDKHNP